MRKKIEWKTYFADFETSVYSGQIATEVWSAAIIEGGAENDPSNVVCMSSLDDFMTYILGLPGDNKIFFHNLKFDGSFILSWLKSNPCMSENAFVNIEHEKVLVDNMKEGLQANHYLYNISIKGIWYSIKIGTPTGLCYIVDSAKLLPFSLAKIGKDLQTEHQKLEMEYTGERHAGYVPTQEELDYICNDVLVLKEGIEKVNKLGIDALTIGSACLKAYRKTVDARELVYRQLYPELDKIAIYRTGESIDEFVRDSYHGGWCYCKERNRLVNEIGCTYDVNSLYPSMMHSESGNYYPVGLPTYAEGFPDKAKKNFYFVRFVCRFQTRAGYLPVVQIKNSMLYDPTEWLKTSDVDGEPHTVRLTMSKPEWELFNAHCIISDLHIEDCVWFGQEIGLFDDYINHWRKIKEESTGALRTIAKLMLNNLYGKFASSSDSSYKICDLVEGVLRYKEVPAYEKEIGYIPVGSAITAYARCFTIRAAQANYDRVCYADTDSIHCIGVPSTIVGVPEHPTHFCRWKCESTWDKAIFCRQKTYIEHVIESDHKQVDPYYNITCAGMGKKCKDNFASDLVSGKASIADFRPGLIVEGNIKAKQIPGGTLLIEAPFVMREHVW